MKLILILSVFSLLGHAALWSWARRVFPGLRAQARWILPLLGALVLATPSLRWLARRSSATPALATASTVVVFEGMVVLVGAVLTTLASIPLSSGVALARRFGRRAAPSPPSTPDSDAATSSEPPTAALAQEPASTSQPSPAALPSKPLSRRDVLERGIGLGAYGATAAVVGWGMLRGRHDYQVEEVVVRIAGLPRQLEGYTIAQVSDLHAGLFVDDDELRRGLSLVRALRPDLVVATGDLVDHDARFAPMLGRCLADLDARDGSWAALGNHDHYAGGGEVAQALEHAGVRMLINDAVHLRPDDGRGLVLLGVDDLVSRWYGGEGHNLGKALARIPTAAREAPRVLLAHQPPFVEIAENRVALQLSGHTHGGQINPGFTPAKLLMRYVAGHYVRGETQLWVNRGFGVAGPPARIGAPPEITKLVLIGA